MRFDFVEYNKIVSNEELIQDIKNVAVTLSLESLSMVEYDENGKYNSSTICRRFGSWNQALEVADIGYRNRFFGEQEFWDNIEKVWIAKGTQPTRRDMNDKTISSISSGAYLRKYGKWSTALKEFVAYINQNRTEQAVIIDKNENAEGIIHKTKRDVNLITRFKVMKRNNFTCCACGASPAKDPTVELHVDHIKPWSKGGETELNNLRTLCSKCNWGKSDLIIE